MLRPSWPCAISLAIAALLAVPAAYRAAPANAQTEGTIINGQIPPPGGIGTFTYGGRYV